MEYSRRRRRHRKSASGASGAPRVIFVLLIVAAAVYFVTTSEAGTWISENVMAPIFTALRPEKSPSGADTPEEQAAQQDPQSAAVSLSAGGDSATTDLTIPAMECYAVQLGAFSSKENADSLAATVKLQNGGGYVLEDEGRYRVLASAYSTESSARDVKEKLALQGVDCTLYPMCTGEATFRVTATKSQTDDVSAGFSALCEAQTALLETALRFDSESMSVSDGISQVKSVLSELDSGMARLSAYEADVGVLSSVFSSCENSRTAINELASYSGESTVDFSSKLKYTYLYVTHEYIRLMEGFSA